MGQLRGQTLPHLVKKETSLVFRCALDLVERRDIVEILMIEPLGQLPELFLEVPKVVGHSLGPHFVHLKGDLNDVPVPMETGALSLVVSKEVGRIVMGLNRKGVHGFCAGFRRSGEEDMAGHGQPEELVPGLLVIQETAPHGRGDGLGILLLDTPHHHTEMIGLHHHTHT